MVVNKMPIKIPSKNIYNINYSKVKNNYIDNLTIGYSEFVKEPQYNQTVFNGSYEIENKTLFIDSEEQNSSDIQSKNAAGYFFDMGVAQIKVMKRYATIKSIIPISGNNSYISTLITGKTSEGTPNINYTLIGQEIKGTCTSYVLREGKTVNPQISYGPLLTDQTEISSTKELDMPSVGSEITHAFNEDGFNANTKLTITDNYSDLVTATASKVNIDGKEYFEITIKYLVDMIIAKLSGMANVNIEVDAKIETSGEFTQYVSDEITINFKGDIISLKQNKISYTIGSKNGRNPIKIEGNELMQQGSSLVSEYTKTLNNYLNGKETAIIKCDIDNYYDYNSGEAILSTKNTNLIPKININKNLYGIAITSIGNEVYLSGYFTSNYSIPIYEIELPKGTYNIYNNNRYLNFNMFVSYQDGALEVKPNEDKLLELQNNTKIIIGVVGKQNYEINGYFKPMVAYGARKAPYSVPKTTKIVFDQYDIVIPMVKGQGNSDIPLSTNKDGSPKQFEVLGVHISSKGKVYQELYIQEI